MNEKNLYLILSVDKNSTDKEIKSAYYKLSKIYHPDINKDIESQHMFKDICDAYKILSNSELKDDYETCCN